MANFARGKYAVSISDISGLQFPYRQMLKQWNGLWVHYSEYEAKQPQLFPKPRIMGAVGLQNARPARVEPAVTKLLSYNPYFSESGNTNMVVLLEGHGYTTSDTVRFREAISFNGFTATKIEDSDGFAVAGTGAPSTWTNYTNYTTDNFFYVNISTETASATGQGGGSITSVGPVTITY